MKKDLCSKKISTVAFQIGYCNRRMPHLWPWFGRQNAAETPWLYLEGPHLRSCPSFSPLMGRRCNAEENITDWGHLQLQRVRKIPPI